MVLAANCFLKYLWWTACYSAWYGIPKLIEQWKAAGTKASFNGWTFIVLEAVAVTVLFNVISLRSTRLSGFLKNGVRLAATLIIAIGSTTVFALVLSWIKQGIR
jgi:hypothetical protein